MMGSDNEPRRRSRLVELFSSEQFYPILDLLSLYLGLADFLVLCQVTKELYPLKDYLRRTYLSINIRLSDFVTAPHMFRSQLGKHDALISGGFALSFFEFNRWKVPNLDVFIEAGICAEEFTNYIREHEGYETSQENNPEVETAQGRLIFSSSTRPGKALRLTRTDGPPIQAILDSSYTTASVNFITWNKAYSIFPVQTVSHHKFYALRSLDNDFGSVLDELSNQGWTTRDMVWQELAADVQVQKIHRCRRVGDRSSLIIPLNTNNVQQASTPDFVIEYAQFEVSTERPNAPGAFQQGAFNLFQQNHFPQNHFQHNQSPQVRVQELISPALRYGYTFALSSWHNYVMERLQRWTWVELYKLEPGKRPEQFANGIPHHSDVSLPQEFQVPKTWDYADDQMPAWYLEWEQTQAGNSVPRSR